MKAQNLVRLGILTSIVGILCLFLVSTVFSFSLELEGPFVVEYIVDGDTIDLDNGERIRFSGINTPESGECWYDEAKESLSSLVLGKEVYLERDFSDTGKYGRKLRYVYVESLFVNGFLVEQGYAKVYDKYKNDTKRYTELKFLEEHAVKKRLGVWNCVDAQAGCLYVASKNSKIYHKPGCKWAKKIKAENLVCFHSEEELGGYQAAKSC